MVQEKYVIDTIQEVDRLKTQLVGRTDKFNFLRRAEYHIKVNKGPIVVKEQNIDYSSGSPLIWDHLDLGIWGIGSWNTSLGSGFTVIRVVNPDNKFEDRIVFNEFNDTSVTTATWDVSSGSILFNGPGNVVQSPSIFLNSETVFRATPTITGSDIGNIDIYLNSNGVSGSGSVGNITNATWTTGKYGSALLVDNDGEYADMGTIDYSGFSEITITGWGYISNPELSHNIILGNAPNNTGDGFSISYYKPTPSLYFYHANLVNSASINEDEWFHFAFIIKEGAQKEWFINGVSQGTQSITSGSTIENSGSNTFIGNGTAANQSWRGYIDDVRIYNRALNSNEINDIKDNKIVGSGLVYKWNFDEGGGNIVNDTAGWEPFTNLTQGTFTTTGSDLRFKFISSGSAEIDKVSIEYFLTA